MFSSGALEMVCASKRSSAVDDPNLSKSRKVNGRGLTGLIPFFLPRAQTKPAEQPMHLEVSLEP